MPPQQCQEIDAADGAFVAPKQRDGDVLLQKSEVPARSHDRLEQRDAQELVAEREAVRQALAQLRADQRRVIALRYGADLTEGDIAQVLGCGAGVEARENRLTLVG
jgi:RNA polymerase sigma factor (sigma-70 family)